MSEQFKQGNLVYKRLKQLGDGQLTASANAQAWQGALAYIVGAKAKQWIIDRGSMSVLARRPNDLFCRLLRGRWRIANSDNAARARILSCMLTNDGAVDGAGASRTISYKHRRDIRGAY